MTHSMKRTIQTLGLLALAAGSASLAFGETPSMLKPTKTGYDVKPVFTVGENITSYTNLLNPTWGASYTPPGILDGIGAYEKDRYTVRVLVTHELTNNRGYAYNVSNGAGGTFSLTGARISYFDINKKTCEVKSAGLAYNTIYDANGVVAANNGFLGNSYAGFSRFCSAALFEAKQFGNSGLENRIFFAPEEDAGTFNPVGGAFWALDPATGKFWHVPALGRGAWENLTELNTGTPDKVALLLADDQDPYNADGVAGDEAAPLYLYVGTKNSAGDFLAKNGLRGGKLYVWVSDTGENLPSEFPSGTLAGEFVEISNATNLGQATENGANGFDEFGFPTQKTLWTRAKAVDSFGFSRPEDVSTNPRNGAEAVLASTGVDTYDLLGNGNGADTFGTLYTIEVDFSGVTGALPATIPADVTVLYNGNTDATRALRSPDNLDWADDGQIYVQEDKAENQTAGTAEPLFGPNAANKNEAQVVKVNPANGAITQIAVIDRTVNLDPSTVGTAVDKGAATPGNQESSGILDVSSLFGTLPGTLFILDVQNHGTNTQTTVNPDSRISNSDLVEGGQLIVLKKDSALEAKIRAEIAQCKKQLAAAKRKRDAAKVRAITRKLKGLEQSLNAVL
jgi:serralysin